MTPSSPVNHVRVRGQIMIATSGSNNVAAWLANGTTTLVATPFTLAANSYGTVPLFYETSNITASTTFNLYAGGSTTTLVNETAAAGAALGGTAATYIEVEEIMGANDNEKVGLPALPKVA
jgi:hypothetical protein